MNCVVRACLDAAFGSSNKKDCKEESQSTSERAGRVTVSDAQRDCRPTAKVASRPYKLDA